MVRQTIIILVITAVCMACGVNSAYCAGAYTPCIDRPQFIQPKFQRAEFLKPDYVKAEIEKVKTEKPVIVQDPFIPPRFVQPKFLQPQFQDCRFLLMQSKEFKQALKDFPKNPADQQGSNATNLNTKAVADRQKEQQNPNSFYFYKPPAKPADEDCCGSTAGSTGNNEQPQVVSTQPKPVIR